MKNAFVTALFLLILLATFLTMAVGGFVPSRLWMVCAIAPALLIGVPISRNFVSRLVPKKRSPLYGNPSSTSGWVVIGIPVVLTCYGFAVSAVGAAATLALGTPHQRAGHISSWVVSRSRRGPDCARVRATIKREPKNLNVTLCLAGVGAGFTGDHYFLVLESPLGDVVAPPL